MNLARILEWDSIVSIVGCHWDMDFFFAIFFFPLLSVINFSALLLEVVSIQGKALEVCLHVEA